MRTIEVVLSRPSLASGIALALLLGLAPIASARPVPAARDRLEALRTAVERARAERQGFESLRTGGKPVSLAPTGTPSTLTSDCSVWSPLASNTAPLTRKSIQLVYDAPRDRVILFGGLTETADANDVWAIDLGATNTLTQLSPTGTPANRSGYSAIYDPVRDRVVVFGGVGVSPTNEVWALSLSGTPAWTQLAPTGTPPDARYWHTAIYDAGRDQMVTFGGTTGAGDVNDAWALSLSGTPAWTSLAPTGTPPDPRDSHTAIYDAPRDRMVVFGGVVGVEPVSEVWSLSLAGTPAWTHVATTGVPPGARYGAVAIYEPAFERMIVYAGHAIDGVMLDEDARDAWSLPMAGSPAWVKLSPGGATPPATEYGGGIYDPVRQRLVTFGGAGEAGDEAWGLALVGSPAWAQLSLSGQTPRARTGHSLVMDTLRGRILMFGGWTLDGTSRDDAWEFDLTSHEWMLIPAAGTQPSARHDHSAIYDTPRDRLVIHGGAGPGGYLRDTWTLAIGTGVWTRITTPGIAPPEHAGHTAIFDPTRNRMVIFGGFDPFSGESREVWNLPLTGASIQWKHMNPGGPLPQQILVHSTVYDAARDRMIVVCDQVWTLGFVGTLGATWTQLAPLGSPPSRVQSAVLDGPRDRLLILDPANGATTLSLAEPFPAWILLGAGGAVPAPRLGGRAVYDPAGDRIVLEGGATESSVLDDVSELTANAFTVSTTALPPGGGTVSASPAAACYPPSTPVTLTATPATGYAFTGWSGDASGTTNPLPIVVNGSQSITAQFTGYTLTTNTSPSGAGTVDRSPNQATYAPGSTVTLTAAGLDGFAFTGWTGAVTGTANPITVTMNGNTAVTAHFVGYTLNATAVPPEHGTVAVSPAQAVYAPGTQVTVTQTPNPGATFTGWTGAATGTANPVTITMDSNKSIVANYSAFVLTTSVSPGGGGTIAVDPAQSFFTPGTIVTLTATPSAGYVFTGWSGAATGTSNPTTITMNGDKSVTAYFTGYVLTALSAPAAGGSVTLNPLQSHYAPGTLVTATASATPPYVFGNWSGSVSGTSNPITFAMDNDRSITANFLAYALTTQVSPAGTGTVARDPSQSLYAPGTVVTVTATPGAGCTFTGWSGSATGTMNPLTVTMDGDKSFTANFQGLTLGVSVSPAASGSITVNPSQSSYGSGSLVTLTANAAVNAAFDHWSGGASGSANPLALTMSANTTVVANFLQFNTPTACETWSTLAPASPIATLTGSAAIWDPVRNRMIVFGGYNGTVFTNSVYVLSGSPTLSWTQLTPSGTPPSARDGACAIYDPVRDRMLVFGGNTNASFVSDVWALSLAGPPAWTPLTPTGAPPLPRFVPSAIYDSPRDRLIVFGGVSLSSTPYTNEVWSLTLSGSPAWTQLVPSGVLPAARASHVAIYDAPRSRMIVHGGDSNAGVGVLRLTDTWQLSLPGLVWTQLSTVGTPPASHAPSAIYDPLRDGMIVFGGFDGAASQSKTSLLSLKSSTPIWIDLHPGGTTPAPRNWQVAAYDPGNIRMLMVGGQGAGDVPVAPTTFSLSLGGLALNYGVNDPLMGTVFQQSSTGCWISGSQETLTASAKPGYHFVDWIGDLTGTVNPQTVAIDGNKAFLARFASNTLLAESVPPDSASAASSRAAEPSASMAPALTTDLASIAPNPYDGSPIRFSLAHDAAVRLSIVDASGRARVVLASGQYSAGAHAIDWDDAGHGARVPPGIYFVRLEVEGRAWVRKLVRL